MVSSDNNKIVALKNQIITKINGLISTHNSNSSAHSTQFQSKADLNHAHGNINNNGTVTATKTTSVQNPADYGSDYFLIRDVDDSNSTKSANVIDVLNKIVEDLIDEGES